MLMAMAAGAERSHVATWLHDEWVMRLVGFDAIREVHDREVQYRLRYG